MAKSFEQLKHIERISRQTRHHQIYLNQINDQKLRRELNNLSNEYEESYMRSRINRKLEQQQKQLLNVTVKQIVRERQRRTLSTDTKQIEQNTIQVLTKKDNENLPSRPSSSIKLPSTETSCRLFSHKCQLYPCQPVYQYTSFTKKENDQTLRQRNPSTKPSDVNSSSYLEELFTHIEEQKYQHNRRQLAVTMHNQHYLAKRHVFMQGTMARLDEQSRILHQRLNDKKNFGFSKDRQHELKQDIQRHLEISAKFCA